MLLVRFLELRVIQDSLEDRLVVVHPADDGSQKHAVEHQTEVLEYVSATLPPDAIVLVDDYNGFPEPPFVKPRMERRWILPGDTFASLRSAGVTHVVVTQRRYENARKGKARALGLDEQGTSAVRHFYERLFAEGTLLREWERGSNNYLQASFKIYALPEKP